MGEDEGRGNDMIYAGIYMALACCTGIMASDYFMLPGTYWFAGLILFTGAFMGSFFLLRRDVFLFQGRSATVRIEMILVLLMALCWGGWRLHSDSEAYEALPSYLAGHSLYIEGQIKEKKNSYDTEDGKKTRYVLKLERFYYDGEEQLHMGKGYLYVTLPAEPMYPLSSRIGMTGTVRPVKYYHNAGMYDAIHRDRQQKIIGTVYSSEDKNDKGEQIDRQLRLIDPPSGWIYHMAQIREGITTRFMGILGRDYAYILSSLLFGGHYDELPRSLLDSFSTTGLIHILSVSGSHIALLLSMIQLAGTALRLRPGLLFFISAVLVLVYGALADFTAPVVRSIIMGLISAYSMTARREYTGHHALALAVLGMVTVSPYLVFDLSFRLSCGASAGIILLQPKIKTYFSRLPSFVGDGLAVCISAQILLLPYIFYCFHAFPVYSFLANLTVAPLLEGIILLGLAAAATGFVIEPVGMLFLWIIKPLLIMAVKGNYWIAALPGSRLWLGAPAFLFTVAYYSGLGAIWGPPMRRRLLIFTSIAALAIHCSWSIWTRPDVSVYIFDMGQDKATCVVERDGLAKVWYNKSRWANPEQIPVVLVPGLHHLGIFHLAEVYVSGDGKERALLQLQQQFSPEKAQFLSNNTMIVKGPFKGASAVIGPSQHPYVLYENLPKKNCPAGTCIEVWSLKGQAHLCFPQSAEALILHRRSGVDVCWEEWLEQSDMAEVLCYDPYIGGEICGRYSRDKWKFSYIGGNRL